MTIVAMSDYLKSQLGFNLKCIKVANKLYEES